MVKNKDELFKKLFAVSGYGKQMRQFQEECGELVVAISHHLRGLDADKRSFISELADIKIMLEQFEWFLKEKDPVSYSMLNTAYEYKLKRLENKLAPLLEHDAVSQETHGAAREEVFYPFCRVSPCAFLGRVMVLVVDNGLFCI